MRTLPGLVLLGLAAACGGPSDDPQEATDATVPADAAPPDAAPGTNGVAACGKPVVFLNLDGVTLTEGEIDDARIDQSAVWAVVAEPPPAAWATAVGDAVLARLAALAIPATTVRPAEGPYTMIVFDADPSDWPSQTSSIQATDCAADNKFNVALVNAEGGVDTPTALGEMETLVLFTVGIATGLDTVTAAAHADNCMRRDRLGAACAFEDGVATDGAACDPTTQDQLALLAERVGCP